MNARRPAFTGRRNRLYPHRVMKDSATVVTVGLVQHQVSSDKKHAVERAVEGIRDVAQRGAEVICLPELFATPYFCQVQDPALFALAEPLHGPTLQVIAAEAKRHKVSVLASVFERRAPGVAHNTLVTLGASGETLGVYRKMHIPQDPQFEEKFYFTPGDTGFGSVRSEKVTLGPLVCWDQWYPEAARLTAMSGAEILVYPTAIGWLPAEKALEGSLQLDAWVTMQRSHAIANGVFTFTVNRTGIETSAAGEIEFWGNSFVCAPTGEVLARAGTGDENLVVRCDLAEIARTRRVWPFFRDRRIDAYERLLERWGDDAAPRGISKDRS